MSTQVPPLLRGLIDDAAVFPPGNAPLPDAVAAHRMHRSAWYAEMIGPLLVPASMLPVLPALLGPQQRIAVGVIGDTGLAGLPEAVAGADLVISATGAAGVVLSEPLLRDATAGRDRPLFVLDIAVPRDVEPTAGDLPNVTLVDIDGLRASVAVRAAETAADIERAHAIVGDEVRRYAERRRAERLGPLFRAMQDRGDAVVRAELERFRSDLAGLEPAEREAVEALARGVVAKLLHGPITRLRASDAPDTDARTLAELLGIEPPGE